MSKYLLDTNIIIDLLRGEPRASQLVQRVQKDPLFVSVVTVAEYYQGAVRSRDAKANIQLFHDLIGHTDLRILPIDQEVAQTYGVLQGALHKHGHAKPILDLQIAATCIVHNLTLITFNVKDFAGIEGLKMYSS